VYEEGSGVAIETVCDSPANLSGTVCEVTCGGEDEEDPGAIIEVSEQPYVRFYGNDVFAGGGFGLTCSLPGADDPKSSARANGMFWEGDQSIAGYRGVSK
jgi:hypothetical protein